MANATLTRRSINHFSWDNRFSNIDVNQKVHLFNQTNKNISNVILHENMVFDDQ